MSGYGYDKQMRRAWLIINASVTKDSLPPGMALKSEKIDTRLMTNMCYHVMDDNETRLEKIFRSGDRAAIDGFCRSRVKDERCPGLLGLDIPRDKHEMNDLYLAYYNTRKEQNDEIKNPGEL